MLVSMGHQFVQSLCKNWLHGRAPVYSCVLLGGLGFFCVRLCRCAAARGPVQKLAAERSGDGESEAGRRCACDKRRAEK